MFTIQCAYFENASLPLRSNIDLRVFRIIMLDEDALADRNAFRSNYQMLADVFTTKPADSHARTCELLISPQTLPLVLWFHLVLNA